MKVKKARHGFKPYRFGLFWKPWTIVSGVIFGEEAKYYLPYPDNYDWNKGGGLSFSMFTNHKNSVMWGWRYSQLYNQFEFTAYIHDNGKVKKEDKNYFVAIPGEPVTIQITIHSSHVAYTFKSGTDSRTFSIPISFKPGRIARRIGAWFGGNNAAPKDLSFILYQNTIE